MRRSIAVNLLLTHRAGTTEVDIIPRQSVFERFLADASAQPAARPAAWDQASAHLAADALFEHLVRETTGSGRGTPPRP